MKKTTLEVREVKTIEEIKRDLETNPRLRNFSFKFVEVRDGIALDVIWGGELLGASQRFFERTAKILEQYDGLVKAEGDKIIARIFREREDRGDAQ